ncbi:MAG: TonB C-terminal domain-containing protein [Acidobacteria bacterium]|nr:TonB C-terminal domain-containing protein [Acidobacteriota bacterium]
MTSVFPTVPKKWQDAHNKKNPVFPISLIISTCLHFLLFFSFLSLGLISPHQKKMDFVNVKIIELPYGEGGALTGTPGGRVESKTEAIRQEKETPPKLTIPDKNEKINEKGKSPIKNPNPDGKAVGLGGKGEAGLGGKARGLVLDNETFEYEWYKARIEQSLKANWRKPFLNKQITASVHFIILADGNVKDVTIVKSSGNTDFDRSVLKAIYDSQPFPKFPPAYSSTALGVLYTFELEPN